jgi:flavin-dependent dehydrogenase
MALEPSGDSVPAKLETKSRVTKVDVENATITLENGETFQGDVVIGADGVHVSLETRLRSRHIC